MFVSYDTRIYISLSFVVFAVVSCPFYLVAAKRARFQRQDVKSSVPMETPRTLDVIEFAQVT
jgi:hypothetical protein